MHDRKRLVRTTCAKAGVSPPPTIITFDQLKFNAENRRVVNARTYHFVWHFISFPFKAPYTLNIVKETMYCE